ncbi:YdbH domain-containing protein [Puniceicoccus vermicola]|uniref:YdbH domain-containing protein n=2 Tax=Puniceicoccus vermicola TaxID=388746 RepID=A0A7X1B2V4_9BACT|nr:YdbH domain-containing protein [Puniceicoccus vermicola]
MKRFFLIAFASLVVIVLAAWFSLPSVIEMAVRFGFQKAGFSDPEIRGIGVTLTSSSVEGVTADWPDGSVGIEEAEVRYRIPRLIRGSADSVRLSGVSIEYAPSKDREEEETKEEESVEEEGAFRKFAMPSIPSIPLSRFWLESFRFKWEEREPVLANLGALFEEHRLEAYAAVPNRDTMLGLVGKVGGNRMRAASGYLSVEDPMAWIRWAFAGSAVSDVLHLESFGLRAAAQWTKDPSRFDFPVLNVEAKLKNLKAGAGDREVEAPEIILEAEAIPGADRVDLFYGVSGLPAGLAVHGIQSLRFDPILSGDGWLGIGPIRGESVSLPFSLGGDLSVLRIGGELGALFHGTGPVDAPVVRGFVRVAGGQLGIQDTPVILDGFRGWLGLELLPDLATLGMQTLEWDRVEYDRFRSGPGRIDWSLSPEKVLQVDRFEWKLLGGELSLDEPSSLNLTDPGRDFDASLHLRGIDLDEVVRVARLDEVEATGRMSGRVRVAAKEGKLIALEAGLDLDSSQEATIRFKDPEWVAEALGGGAGNSDVLTRAVSDLRLKSLHVEVFFLRKGAKNTFIEISGSSRAPDIQAPSINLDFNFQIPFEKVFRLVLLGKQISLSAGG